MLKELVVYWPEIAGDIYSDQINGVFSYKNHTLQVSRQGSCGVRIFESDKSRVFLIILTELKNGPSVTNAIEDIVNQVFRKIKSEVGLRSPKPDEDEDCVFLFVERYEIHPNEFDWVELKYDLGKWHSPTWTRANVNETNFLLNVMLDLYQT